MGLALMEGVSPGPQSEVAMLLLFLTLEHSLRYSFDNLRDVR